VSSTLEVVLLGVLSCFQIIAIVFLGVSREYVIVYFTVGRIDPSAKRAGVDMWAEAVEGDSRWTDTDCIGIG
jgi:hypothetical protein